jgi:phage baseplate assembly protein W
MAGYSLKLPVALEPNDGFALLQTTKEVALQNLRMVLFTEPGERVWDANFGVGAKRFLFEQNTSFSRRQLREKIIQQISRYLPYINILELSVDAIDSDNNIVEDDSNFVKVSLLFNLSNSNTIPFQETISL